MTANWDDVVRRCQPRWFDTQGFGGTEGRDWEWDFTAVLDTAGVPVDFSTGTTAVCEVWTADGLTSVMTLTFTGFSDGTFKLTQTGANTAGKATDAANASNSATATKPRKCLWSLEVTKSSKSAQFFGPRGSVFTIDAE
jgi:hypothetical protein